MAIKAYRPTTNGRRGMTTLANEEITTSKVYSRNLSKRNRC